MPSPAWKTKAEREIERRATPPSDGKPTRAELPGGTFTTPKRRVYGTLLSTPIPHPPPSGILRIHRIDQLAAGGATRCRPRRLSHERRGTWARRRHAAQGQGRPRPDAGRRGSLHEDPRRMVGRDGVFFLMRARRPRSTLFPYTTLFR